MRLPIDCNRQNKVRAVRVALTERKLWIEPGSLRTGSILCGVVWRRMRRAVTETVNSNKVRDNRRASDNRNRKVSSKGNKARDNKARVNRDRTVDSSKVDLKTVAPPVVSQPAIDN